MKTENKNLMKEVIEKSEIVEIKEERQIEAIDIMSDEELYEAIINQL